LLSSVDVLLNLLVDWEWHRLVEVLEKLKIQHGTLTVILEFLHEYEFVDYQANEEKVKINPRLKQLVLGDEANVDEK